MNLPSLLIKSHILEYQAHEKKPPLKVVAEAYTIDGNAKTRNAETLTLILTTGIGAGTETWIPAIRRLFRLQARKDSGIHIETIWAINSPNQGQAAILNERVLKEHYSDIWQLSYYGNALRAVFASGLINFCSSRIVAMSHSAGVGAFITAAPANERIPYDVLIAVEMGIVPRKCGSFLRRLSKGLSPKIMARDDVWPSKEKAIEWMGKHNPRKYWHPESLQAVKDHSLRDLPTIEYPDKEGVTTLTYKGQEAAAFQCIDENFFCADELSRFCASIPVHAIWGQRKDFWPKEVQQSLCDPAEGRKMTSVREIPDTGHWLVQEKPDQISDIIFKILQDTFAQMVSSKL